MSRIKHITLLICCLAAICSLQVAAQVIIPENASVKYDIQIPEVQELMFVIFAISETGKADPYMIDQSTAYYQETMQWFSGFSREKAVLKTNKALRKKYNQLRMEACTYTFDADGKIVKKPGNPHYGWGKKDHLKPLLKDLTAFAEISNFRQFFALHKEYYATLTAEMEKLSLLPEQVNWLNDRSEIKYREAHLFFSPLGIGRHSTDARFAVKNRQIILFVSGPVMPSATLTDENIRKGYTSRMVFTEVDHNYVNPISDKYKKQIKTSFPKRAWADQDKTKGYGNAYAVFNEYMTWGLYLIFARETFPESTYDILRRQVTEQMEKRRGFIRFGAFYEQMARIAPAHTTLESLYPPMLDWAEE